MKKIIFAGSPKLAAEILAELHKNFPVALVLTAPDKKKGRGKKLESTPVKQFALENNIEVITPITLKDNEVKELIEKLNPDIFIVVAYGFLIPENILFVPKFGCLNIHFSLLPRWRGASPIQHCLLTGDKKTGISFMQMDKGLDTGAVFKKIEIKLTGEETTETLSQQLTAIAKVELAKVLPLIFEEKIILQKQDEEKATIAGKISKDAGLINWQEKAEIINNKIRAYYPWPGSFSFLDNKKIRIIKSYIIDYKSEEKPGTIIAINKDSFTVQTLDKSLVITHVQLEGGKVLSVKDLKNGRPDLLTPYRVFTSNNDNK